MLAGGTPESAMEAAFAKETAAIRMGFVHGHVILEALPMEAAVRPAPSIAGQINKNGSCQKAAGFARTI
jgi:hypothetical protein